MCHNLSLYIVIFGYKNYKVYDTVWDLEWSRVDKSIDRINQDPSIICLHKMVSLYLQFVDKLLYNESRRGFQTLLIWKAYWLT